MDTLGWRHALEVEADSRVDAEGFLDDGVKIRKLLGVGPGDDFGV
jgi:hypothetical protein